MNVLQVTFYGVYNVLLVCSGNTCAHTCVGAYGDERRTSGVLLRSHPPGFGGQDLSLVWSSSHKVGWLACELQRCPSSLPPQCRVRSAHLCVRSSVEFLGTERSPHTWAASASRPVLFLWPLGFFFFKCILFNLENFRFLNYSL